MIPRRYWLSLLIFIGVVYFITRSGVPERTTWPTWLQNAPVPIACIQFYQGECQALQIVWPLDETMWITPRLPSTGPIDFFWRGSLNCSLPASLGEPGLFTVLTCKPQHPVEWRPATWEEISPTSQFFAYGLRDHTWVELTVQVVTWVLRDTRWWPVIQPASGTPIPGSPVWVEPSRRILGIALPTEWDDEWWVWPLIPSTGPSKLRLPVAQPAIQLSHAEMEP